MLRLTIVTVVKRRVALHHHLFVFFMDFSSYDTVCRFSLNIIEFYWFYWWQVYDVLPADEIRGFVNT